MINAEIRAVAERLCRLEEDKKAIADDIRDLKAEAKASGYDISVLTKTVRLMLMEKGKRETALEQHDLLDTYLGAVGLLPESKSADKGEDIHAPPDDAAIDELVEKAAKLPPKLLVQILEYSRTEVGRRLLNQAISLVKDGTPEELARAAA